MRDEQGPSDNEKKIAGAQKEHDRILAEDATYKAYRTQIRMRPK